MKEIFPSPLQDARRRDAARTRRRTSAGTRSSRPDRTGTPALLQLSPRTPAHGGSDPMKFPLPARTIAVALFAASFAAAPHAATPPPDATQLVQNELDFGRDVAHLGIRAGFMKWLAPTSVVFRPQPVNGPKAY